MFEEFWSQYPRKVARKDAERAWKKLDASQQFAALQSLPIHVKYWELSGRTKETTPHASSWLNGERWTDELEMPKPKAGEDWMRSTAGIMAKDKEVGIEPKLGEDWHCLKARVMARAA